MRKIYCIIILLFVLMPSVAFATTQTIQTTQTVQTTQTTQTAKVNLKLTFIIVEYSKERGDTNRFTAKQESMDPGDTIQNFSVVLPAMGNGQDLSKITAALRVGDDIWTIENESIVRIGEGRLVVDTSMNVKDGEEGSVKLITKEPYNTVKTIGNNQQNVIEFIDVGVDIKAKPVILSNKSISSEIVLKLSEVMRESEEERNVHVPVVTSRDLNTNINFKVGQLELLGELAIDKKIKVRSGVPFLRNIPLLGPLLFSSFREQAVKTKLYIVAGIKYSDQSKMSDFQKMKDENLKEIKDKIILR